ncbi:MULTISPECIES: YhcN/YlaJ family sporulation lipoprotein [Brevibacillus]|uniref:YhcN/YlaJ family sporulation lipoprotein n=1 Tax=Brevibacillus TaxID=55080 RepID=UPI000D0F3EDC|nr:MULTISPECIES: YhcN/YlaJ family sporulation lipoprotein [Brevibacillus]MED1947326.1 YhcN/YlaJ family sporulation lipoprotein [Brevibacillus formosus]MED1997407.1 YhcN/YlaJ family sporulation lipoprotein [Brevibacillus formosus]MED2083264.1 YhcN/YlaJ family sporulation lipoprotein [Brevibacillus formosus]PSK16914.1 sporulation protein [Brevibacillus sp. NRRL NRS-603]
MKRYGPKCLVGLLMLATMMTGCANSSSHPKNQAHTQSTTYQQAPGARTSLAHDYHANTDGINARNYQKGYTVNGFNQDLAEQLTLAADEVPGVERATVLVSGTDAVIGIRVRKNFGPEQTSIIEQQVHSAVRSRVPNFSIQVASDAATFDRIRAIHADIYEEATHLTNQVNTSTEFRSLLQDIGRRIPTVTP